MKSIFKKSYCAKKLTIYFLRNNWYVFHEQGLTCIRNENYFLIGSYCRTFLQKTQNGCIANDEEREKNKHSGCKIEDFSSYS